MSRFSETVRDERGHPIPNVTVYVYEWDSPSGTTGSLSALTDDDLVTALPNPLTTDEFGEFYFNVNDGVKQIEYHYGGKLLYREQILLGLVVSGTAAGVAFNMYAIADTGQKANYLYRPPDPGAHIGTAFGGFCIEHRPTGSGANGPTSGDYAVRVSSIKSGWPATSVLGEIGCLDLTVRQNSGDASTILMNAQQTVGAGWIAAFESNTSQVDPATAYSITYNINAQCGVIDGTAQYGLHLSATAGTPSHGLIVRSTGAAVWDNALTYLKDSTTLFNIDGNGIMTVGSLTANADAPVTGYVSIKTTDGTTRKLAVIA